MVRLGEALQLIGQSAGERKMNVPLLCGFVPLHLETFVKAYLTLRFPGTDVSVSTGLYGDLEGSVRRARGSGGDGAIVVIEWSDLDQRLSFRASAGWKIETLDDVVAQVKEKCQRLEVGLAELAETMPVVLIAPGLGLPPLTHMPAGQASSLELELDVILAQFLERVCDKDGIRLVSRAALDLRSPAAGRHDVRMDLSTGFPYSVAHADAVAELSVSCLFPALPKKGLITDLDETLWKGILGDAGVDGVSWSLAEKSQAYALYQQTIASLADSGVLVAIASKNDKEMVAAALQRSDILLQSSQIFPIEVGWGAKSEAVGRILEAWNIGADSVVFVDDSPLELAEVEDKHPGIECLRFPSDDPAAILSLLWQLRARFGKSEIRDEDRLRLKSLRDSAAVRQESAAKLSGDFLARLNGKITLEAAGEDGRAFELVNKTNQFNLNGRRYTEVEWKALAQRTAGFLAIASYEDRFGPLGKIAVLAGHCEKQVCHVDVWVMSCRAFSRQIEFQIIKQLFHNTGASQIRFHFQQTPRNGPLQSFLSEFALVTSLTEGELCLPVEQFDRLCPPLFHQVNDKWTPLERN